MGQIYDNPMVFLSALQVMANAKNETPEMIHKELVTLCVDFLQFQSNYAKKTENEQFNLRPTRNEMIIHIFQELKEINRYSDCVIFCFEMPDSLRPFERGKRISEAVKNIIDVFRFIKSSEVIQKLRECI